MIDRIQWQGYGSFLIQGPPIIYINPWRIARHAFHADVILVGHGHYEAFSPADIQKLSGPNTRVIANERVVQEMDSAEYLRPWQSLTVDRASIKSVPAYSPTSALHPLRDGGLGFVISMHLYDIYYAGDTQIIPEMRRIRPDIAILPIDGQGTMTGEEAVAAVDLMRPRWVIPSNWSTQPGGATPLDVLQFKKAIGDLAEVVAPVRTQ